jgi:SAM-dependent methyltransferase
LGAAPDPVDRAASSVALFERVMAGAGMPLQRGARILDFGCGDGSIVAAFRRAGYDAYGCDFEVGESATLKPIERPYRLPYADASFDFVGSTQVLEHVRDHGAAFCEIRRILKAEGSTLHFFPSKWRPIEPHIGVPLATLIQSRPWLYVWAAIGIRNEFQAGKGAREVARLNKDYLQRHTNYLGRKELTRIASRWFEEVHFVERLIFTTSRRRDVRLVAPVVQRVPPIARLYSAAAARLMLMR